MTTDFLKGHKILLVSALFTRALWEIVPMQVPILAGAMVDGLNGSPVMIYGVDLSALNVQQVVNLAATSLGILAIAYGVSAYAYTVTGSRLGELFVADLRRKVAQKILQLPLSKQQQLGTGELLDRTVNDTGRLRTFIDQVVIRTSTNFLRIGYPMFMLLILDWYLALLALSVIPAQWIVSTRLQKRLFTLTQESLAARAKLTLDVSETLGGAETIQSINSEESRRRISEKDIQNVARLQRKTNQLTACIRATVWLATGLGIALVWWQGSQNVAAGGMTVGTLIVFTGFMEFAYRPFRFFPKVVKSFEQGRASIQRISELLEIPTIDQRSANLPELCLKQGEISFSEVRMAYQGEEVIRGINLKVESNQLTAFVGPSGSGKSTLLRLISRLYEKSAGEILIDGQSIDQVRLASLRSQIAFVPQQSKVFSGTIYENLLAGNPEATDQEVRQACMDGGAWEFIERLPEGWCTIVGPDGIALSGGQSQRLAISRALVCQPKILLLDEPTSALDSKSQEHVMESLYKLKEKVTIVLVGHRVSTFSEADKIVLIEDGQISAEGTHDKLVDESVEYQELAFGALGGADKSTNRLVLRA